MGKYRKDFYLKIGEVSKQFDIETHVLRYWEKEFPSLKPKKNRSGQRIYSRENVALIKKIKDLLHNERYSIEGAKRVLQKEKETKPFQSDLFNSPEKKTDPTEKNEEKEMVNKAPSSPLLLTVKKELEELLTLLERKIPYEHE